MSETSNSSQNKLRKFKAGDILFKEGEPGHKVYIVKEGEIRISTQKDDKAVTLGILKKGACFGEMAVISSAPRVASAIAKTDAEVYEIDSSHVDKMIEDLSPLFRAIVNSLIKRVATLNNFATENSTLGHALSSLAHLIMLLLKTQKNDATTMPETASELAASTPAWARQPDPIEETPKVNTEEKAQVPVRLIIETGQTVLGVTKGRIQKLLDQFIKFDIAKFEQKGSQEVLSFHPESFIEQTDKTLSALGHMIDEELTADLEYVDLIEMAKQMDTQPRYLIDAVVTGRLPQEAVVLKQSLVRRAIEEQGRMFF
ncbi:cyclic nucleotide-binding domain-containing protein [Hydrogenovibrio kuenenii]|uniref:cyclic nucleotide-binding domain-containing protein n=1 Tax=Hydrogenovibrio kuenenii TaxID=63658 RepID=UPI000464008E|nr:cyclic nucleotide-binding domain-containing protein [Hydrogenovibrio kuenenii]